MKAAQLINYGGQDTVKVQDAAEPIAGPGQVLVKVAAAGVNPFDFKVRDGLAKLAEGIEFPATLGGDVAGTVTAVGEGVTGFATGAAVYGQASAVGGQGSFAEFVPVKAEQLSPKPESIDFDTAAALPLAAASAYQAIVDEINLQSGQKILIHGGAGGIGNFAVQLAKHLGAYVATTVSAEDIEFVKQLGADEVIDYTSQDFSTLLHDYDAVFDTAGGEANQKSYAVLKDGGQFVAMSTPPNEEQVKAKQLNYVAQFSRVTADRLQHIAELVDSGALQVTIDKVFSLDQAAEALEYLKTGHHRGKVVIRVADQ